MAEADEKEWYAHSKHSNSYYCYLCSS